MKPGVRTFLFIFVFLLPLAVITVYELFYSSDRYHSSSNILITQDNSSSQTLDLSVIGLPTVASSKDALTLVTFIESLDMTQHLESKLQLRQHYSDAKADWLSRFDASKSEEEFHDYMSGYITVAYDVESELVNIEVQAFTRDYAQQVVNAILARSQEFVDKLNAGVTNEQTKFFEKQLASAEQRVKQAKEELLAFQRENNLYSTDSEAIVINTNIATLERMLLEKQGELTTRLKELNENSPAIQVLRTEIETIKQQLTKEKERLTGTSSAAVSELDSKFREIQFNLEFVTNIYKSNLSQLEQARLEAVQRLKYLVVVTNPSLADSSLYPDRPYIILSSIMGLLILYFVSSLLVAIIREHA